MGIDVIFAVAVLIMSVVIHEVSHGYSAYLLGDSTAKRAGRLTLNPISHLDLFGSILIPFLSYTFGGFIFGWAKPVPYNPYNLKSQKWGPAIVGAAGPGANIFIAIIFGLFFRFGLQFGFMTGSLMEILSLIIFINILLAVFNLLPIPPLDGSKLLFAVLPYKWRNVQVFLERHGFYVLIFFIFFLWRFLFPIISIVFKLITGVGF